MSVRLDARHVVVSGGTGALGTAVVTHLLTEGAVCHVPSLDDAERARFAHRDHARVRLAANIDLADEDQVRAFYDGIETPWASVHLAGGFAMAPIERVSADDFRAMMRLNVLTAFLCCREAVRRMRTAGGGRIVNVAARAALEPRTGAKMTAYTASKAAVAALTLSLAEEVADAGILVNAIVPSIIDTPANRAAMPKADHARWPTPAAIAATIADLIAPDNAVARGALVTVYGRS